MQPLPSSRRGLLASMVVVLCSCATAREPVQQPKSQDMSGGDRSIQPPAPREPERVADAGSPMAPALPRACDMYARPGVLKRAALVRLIDAGIPRWLQGVEGDRALANHRFQGWLVKSIYPGDPCYRELDLRAGDVVQKVNGKPIEKPEQAFDVVESLRTAPALTVEYLREGKAERLSISITDEP
jgi:hypothetical protein